MIEILMRCCCCCCSCCCRGYCCGGMTFLHNTSLAFDRHNYQLEYYRSRYRNGYLCSLRLVVIDRLKHWVDWNTYKYLLETRRRKVADQPIFQRYCQFERSIIRGYAKRSSNLVKRRQRWRKLLKRFNVVNDGRGGNNWQLS